MPHLAESFVCPLIYRRSSRNDSSEGWRLYSLPMHGAVHAESRRHKPRELLLASLPVKTIS